MSDPPTLPRDAAAERYYLGCFFRYPERAEELFALGVSDSDFFDPFHQTLYKAICEQHQRGGINVELLRARLKPEPLAHDLSSDYFDELALLAVTTAHAKDEAAKIKEASLKRRLSPILEHYREQSRNGVAFDTTLRGLTADLGDLERGNQSAIELPMVSSVESRSVDWAWSGFLPRGMLTLLDGDPDRGKSQITCDVAARWSYPRPFPFAQGDDIGEAGNVLMMAAEDNADTTIRPRLDAAGANLDRIYLWPEERDPIVLPNDIDTLAAAVKCHDVGLLIIDPLGAYLHDSINSNKDADVRRALRPLVSLAQETNVAVLAVRHLNKDENKSALYRGGGSIAFTAAARVVWAVGSDPNQADRMVLAVLKSNIGKKPPSLSYSIEGVGTTSRIRWEGESACTIADIFGRKHERGGKASEAESLLLDLLADGPRPAREVEEAMEAANIKDWTYKRARKELGVISSKGSMREGWLLSLPEGDGFAAEQGEGDGIA